MQLRVDGPLAQTVHGVIALLVLAALVVWRLNSLVVIRPTCSHSAGIPDYVYTYAPICFLDEEETFYPSDLQTHLDHTQPEIDFAVVAGPSPLTLSNVGDLNRYLQNSSDIYLTSKDDVTTRPAWLEGEVPDAAGTTVNATSAVIIVRDGGDGWVDAFYLYFYSFDRGNTFLGMELGDHVGDWEHTMVRFYGGAPQALWYSQHGFGQAFTYASVEKLGRRPVVYVARGTHANYAVPGPHDHTLPDFHQRRGLVVDYTSRGPRWDPVANAYAYTYDAVTDRLAAVGGGDGDGVGDRDGDGDGDGDGGGDAPEPAPRPDPLSFLTYRGRWGDKQYPDSDPRQFNFLHLEWRYVDGPTGPLDKDLNRTSMCSQRQFPCVVHDQLRA